MAKKICFVVQRYGLEVNGGAELHAMQLAEHMLSKYPEIHVVTTKAIDYITWANEYDADAETINGIIVHRFPTEHERVLSEFFKINDKLESVGLTPLEEADWVEKQGPYSPKLLEYIREHKDDYDAFIFFTYLYYPTIYGIKEVADKALVIPTTHDEPAFTTSIIDDVFLLPKAIAFNTEEEKRLIQSKYENDDIPHCVGAIGIHKPQDVKPQRFKMKYGLDDFIIYTGRIDKTKNCDQLFRYFCEYRRRTHDDIKLVLMGKQIIDVPEREDIISLGFVSDQDKADGIAAARALIMPSQLESLSMSTLEGMLLGAPVLVNGNCPVLKGHCIKSNGALYYTDYLEFEKLLHMILHDERLSESLRENGRRYVEENYDWNRIVENISALIES
ncbi:MAG: glycosyltransferase family 4 protein [Eggerthellaceae bacterium]|nr:glycosyltransferase family 4 protein [Eggerthellaceae bacterium]